jgi:hypothetical protein
VSFQTVNFGKRRVSPQPAGDGFSLDVDLRPQKNLIVRINGSLNVATRQLSWKFFSLDPATGLPTTNPLEGFLPPNLNPPEGDGSVLFSVSPKTGLASGTVVSNQASIVFDDNAAIVTPVWSNQVDNTHPTSRVQSLPPVHTSASFVVNWSGNDTGAGIADYTIYVSDNGGVFTPWLVTTTATQATFNSSANHTYSFFSVARDLAGNSESGKNTAEAMTQIVGTGTINGSITDSGGNAIPNVTITLSGSRLGTAVTTTAGSYSFTELPGGNYLVTPTRFGYSFIPANRSISSLTGNQLANFTGGFAPGVPILVSEETSTRAVALDSVAHLRDPFLSVMPIPWNADRRTRVMLFTMNLELLQGEPMSTVTVDAEDASHNLHPLTVEFVGAVPGTDWLGCVVVRLPEVLGDVGDVLVRVRARGISSNRVRLGIGHSGGGPPDDPGSVPTPGREPK